MLKREYTLNISNNFRCLLLLFIFTSFCLCFTLSWPIFIRICLALLVISYGTWLMWSQGLITRCANSLRPIGDNCWLIRWQGREWVGRLRGDSVITAKLTLLRFDTDQQRLPRSILVFADALSATDYHALVVEMRARQKNRSP